MQNICNECGYPLNGHETACPECGCTVNECKVKDEAIMADKKSGIDNSYKTVSELFWSCQFYKVFKGNYFDLGQRIYEVGLLWWECVKVWWICCTTKFAKFNGRASRREYFSFVGLGIFLTPFIFSLYLIFGIIPWLAISVRRMHDVGKSGWWLLVPIANYFLLFKQSDKGVNKYGLPSTVVLD